MYNKIKSMQGSTQELERVGKQGVSNGRLQLYSSLYR
jgi:hypothetical protein